MFLMFIAAFTIYIIIPYCVIDLFCEYHRQKERTKNGNPRHTRSHW